VGEKAHQQIIENRPYKDILEFCQKIEEFKVKNTITYEKINEDGTKEQKTRKGTSALNRGVVYSLIISGTMDSLFPENLTTLEKLYAYEEAMAKASNKKKAAKVDESFVNINALTKFQMRKEILPAYSESLLSIFTDIYQTIPNLTIDNQRLHYQDNRQPIPFVDARGIEIIENRWEATPGSRSIKVAVACYIMEGKRFWNDKAVKAILMVNVWKPKNGHLKAKIRLCQVSH